MVIYALPIPPECANCSLRNLDLRGKFHLLVFAMETEEGVSTDLRADTELVKGATLWCTFEPFRRAEDLVREFLGKAPRSLQSRCVALSAFHVSDVPEWIDQTIEDTKIRPQYGVVLCGVYRKSESGYVVMFPTPARELKEDSVLLMLKSDLHALNELQGLNAPKDSSCTSVCSFHVTTQACEAPMV